jgi:hypothetical protein
VIKPLLILAGTLSLILGITGIFIPGLPTTPFIILTAGLYARSSDRLYQLLISYKPTGGYILKYRANKGMSLKSKVFSICTMWVMIIISCTFFIKSPEAITIVLLAGITGTFVMGLIVPASKTSKGNIG